MHHWERITSSIHGTAKVRLLPKGRGFSAHSFSEFPDESEDPLKRVFEEQMLNEPLKRKSPRAFLKRNETSQTIRIVRLLTSNRRFTSFHLRDAFCITFLKFKCFEYQSVHKTEITKSKNQREKHQWKILFCFRIFPNFSIIDQQFTIAASAWSFQSLGPSWGLDVKWWNYEKML